MEPRLWTRRSVIVFFAIGFGVPWIGWSVLALTDIARPSALATALFYTGDFMTIGGLAAAWVAGGAEGLRGLFRRVLRVRAPVGWALFALFVPLATATITTLAYGATHGGIGRIELAGLATYAAPGVLLALTTGPLGEEAGWRGFLLPRMLRRYSPLGASLLLGLIWSVWHYPLYVESVFATARGAFFFTASVLCFSVLLTVLWAHTGGSVFWAVVLHWTINISGRVVEAVFPDVRVPEATADAIGLVVLIVVSVGSVALVGPATLRHRLEAVMATLGTESLAQDRS